jgi:hypothetical protein
MIINWLFDNLPLICLTYMFIIQKYWYPSNQHPFLSYNNLTGTQFY